MTRKRTKELLSVIIGYVKGRTIQYKNAKCKWIDCFYQDDIDFDRPSTQYRLKPK